MLHKDVIRPTSFLCENLQKIMKNNYAFLQQQCAKRIVCFHLEGIIAKRVFQIKIVVLSFRLNVTYSYTIMVTTAISPVLVPYCKSKRIIALQETDIYLYSV